MLKLGLGRGDVELDIAPEVNSSDSVSWHTDNRVLNVGCVSSGLLNA